jgi:alpha-methylacyl-CoA racemase
VFLTKTRDEWCALLEGTDVCFAPVLPMSEAAAHPHNVARRTFVDAHGTVQPSPAPRFSRTEASIQGPPAVVGQHTDETLRAWGFTDDEVAALHDARAIAQT